MNARPTTCPADLDPATRRGYVDVWFIDGAYVPAADWPRPDYRTRETLN